MKNSFGLENVSTFTRIKRTATITHKESGRRSQTKAGSPGKLEGLHPTARSSVLREKVDVHKQVVSRLSVSSDRQLDVRLAESGRRPTELSLLSAVLAVQSTALKERWQRPQRVDSRLVGKEPDSSLFDSKRERKRPFLEPSLRLSVLTR